MPGRYVPPPEARTLYQAFTPEEDQARTNLHYEQPVEFFYLITGGRWNVYSANLWTASADETSSQEAKLDLLAGILGLREGQRILDVGCGWGGPLTYLCERYGVRGVGLTLSPAQQAAATERITRHGVDAQVIVRHWREYAADEPFDAVFTDEVIVHFQDLGGFFARVNGLLRAGGWMLNKELHFVHERYATVTRAMAFVNDIYGSTGNYRTLADELRLANGAGFDVAVVHQIAREHYQRTLDRWLANMRAHRERLVALSGPDHYRRFRTYLKVVRGVLGGETMTLDVVGSRKPT
ncbi:MAG TPA: class I SAM-dependent methyltransferase [Candidatus Limnocylindria bacterium]|nr:class I SAM-dependent methyltransferase [Candidatus Limnocylindria bacterium]